MITYSQVDDDVRTRVDRLLQAHHSMLVDYEVRIDLLFAHPDLDEEGIPKGPPVMLNGYPCAAVVKITGPKDRAKGCGDAEIVIDHDAYQEMSPEVRDALLDHELQHIESTGEFDDMRRPKLSLRLHDHSFGWFDVVVKRHGAASLEQQQLDVFLQAIYEPYWKPWARSPRQQSARSGTR